MKSRLKQIGFNQKIKLEWMEYTAGLVLAGMDRTAIRESLQEYLKDQISGGGSSKRGGREKAISVLVKCWSDPPQDLLALHKDGLQLFRNLPKPQHLPLHWGMAMAVYPFFRFVAEATGRLINLQGDVASVQVQRRMKERLGERETVAREVRRVLRAFHEWGVLEDTESKGLYVPAAQFEISDSSLSAWLLGAFLLSSEKKSMPVKSILSSPGMFPFRLPATSSHTFQPHSWLESFRHGLDEEMVAIKG